MNKIASTAVLIAVSVNAQNRSRGQTGVPTGIEVLSQSRPLSATRPMRRETET